LDAVVAPHAVVLLPCEPGPHSHVQPLREVAAALVRRDAAVAAPPSAVAGWRAAGPGLVQGPVHPVPPPVFHALEQQQASPLPATRGLKVKRPSASEPPLGRLERQRGAPIVGSSRPQVCRRSRFVRGRQGLGRAMISPPNLHWSASRSL